MAIKKKIVRVNITEVTKLEAITINMAALFYEYSISVTDFFKNFNWDIFWATSNLFDIIAEVIVLPLRVLLWGIAYLARTVVFLLMYIYLIPYYVIRALITLKKAKKEEWQREIKVRRKIEEE